MAYLFDTGIFAVNTSTGAVAPGATLTFYAAGTASLLDTYSTIALDPLLKNTNPVVADGSGVFGPIWFSDVLYKVKLTLPDGSTRTRDNVGDTVSVNLASTAPGKGAALVGAEGGGTVQDTIDLVAPQSAAAYNKLLKRKYLIDDYIPQNLWAGIRNGSNTTPLDTYLTAAAADMDGTKLIISEGTFLHAATWDIKGRTAFEIEGGNPQAVLFKPSFLTGDVIDIGSATAGVLSGAHIHGIGVNSTTARTSGSFLRMRNITSVHFENFWMAGQACGVEVGSGIVKSTIGGAGIARIINPTDTTGLGILVTGGTLITLQNLLIEGDSGAQGLGAIKLTNVSDIGIKDCTATYSRDALIVEPGGGETVEQVWTRDNTWDSGSGTGMVFKGSGTIRVFTSTDDWSATNGARGVWLKTGPTIQDVKFKGLESYNNAQEGLLAENCQGWFALTDSTVAGNSTSLANANDGVRIVPGASAVSKFRIAGVRSGVTGQFTNAQRYGIRVDAGTATTYTIQGCDTDGNGTGGLSDAGTASVTKSVTANVP